MKVVTFFHRTREDWRLTRHVRFVLALWVALAAAAGAFVPGDDARTAWSQGWPLPPPGSYVRPKDPEPITSRPSIPTVPGAILHIVQPVPLPPIPRVPPIPYGYLTSGEPDEHQRLRLRIEAGAILQTTQLVYEPLKIDQAPAFNAGVTPLRLFRWQALDSRANEVAPPIVRPLVLEVPAPANAVNVLSLLLWQYDEQHKLWQPLATTWDRERNVLFTRIATFGVFAVAEEKVPYKTSPPR